MVNRTTANKKRVRANAKRRWSSELTSKEANSARKAANKTFDSVSKKGSTTNVLSKVLWNARNPEVRNAEKAQHRARMKDPLDGGRPGIRKRDNRIRTQRRARTKTKHV